MTDLKPCPFCNHVGVDDELAGEKHMAACRGCGAAGPMCDSEAAAIATWNRRASPWIRVTPETMPEEDQRVLVYRYDGVVVSGEYTELSGFDCDDDTFCEPPYRDEVGVSYWQPLPEPPEET